VSSGTFTVGDPVVYERQIPATTGPWLIQAVGTYGGIVGGNMLFIRKDGVTFDPIAGDQIRDRRSGAIFTPTANTPNDFATIRRWHVYLSQQDFRAYFVVQVPALDYGDFGFAYDVSSQGFYDLTPQYLDFYDGYSVGNAPIYQGVYQQLQATIAGGVGFDLLLADGPCV
jgi:hypothetical protein